MRKLIYFTTAAFFLLAGCSKNDSFDFGRVHSDLICTHQTYSQVIVVKPDKSGDDTEAILDAITNAGPGSLIKLTEGEYHVGYMELYGFQGTIAGAGCEKTTIILSTSIDQTSQNNNNQLSAWWESLAVM